MSAQHRKPTHRRHLAVVALVIVGWLGIASVAGPLFGQLSSVQKNDSAAFLPESAESTKAGEIAAKFTQGNQEVLPTLVLWTGTVTPDVLTTLTAKVQELPNLPVGEKKLSDYLAPGAALVPIPSPDGKAVLLSLPLDGVAIGEPIDGEPAMLPIITAIRSAVSDVPNTESYVTGIGGILADLFKSFSTIDTALLGITLIVVALILIVVYRSPFLWILPLFSAMVALATGGALVYLLAKQGSIDLDGQSQGILSVLVLGAATDYALLLIARYREELHHHASRFDSMRAAIRGVLEPIVASGFTVIAGLLVLTLSDLKSVRSLGPVSAIGILAAQAVMLTLLPMLLVAFPRWVFWPKVPRFDDVDERLSGFWSKVAAIVQRRPKWLGALVTIVLVGFMAVASQLNSGGLTQGDSFTSKPESVVGLKKLSEHFPAGVGDPAIVVVPQADLAAVTAAAQGAKGVTSVKPTVGQGTTEPLVVDGWMQLEVTLSEPSDSLAGQALIPKLREVVHAASADALVGGSAAVNYDMQQTNIRDRDLIIPVALLVITFILALLLRSLIAPIVLVATTVLSFGATLGICHLVFTYLLGYAGVDGSFPLFAFVFLVALGIDYNIFLMTRVREEVIKLGHFAGINKGLTVTGGVITSAGIVLAATFGVLATLPLVFLVELGFAVAFGVLLDTILVRSILVPALAHWFGPAIWWPSKIGRATQ